MNLGPNQMSLVFFQDPFLRRLHFCSLFSILFFFFLSQLGMWNKFLWTKIIFGARCDERLHESDDGPNKKAWRFWWRINDGIKMQKAKVASPFEDNRSSMGLRSSLCTWPRTFKIDPSVLISWMTADIRIVFVQHPRQSLISRRFF